MLLKAYLIKIYMNIAEFIGRVFFLNRNMPKGCSKFHNIPYSKKGLLDVFFPEGTKRRLPVLVYMHGGGWVTGSRRTCRRLCRVLAMEGYTVLNVKYRLAPVHKHPKALEDIGRVLSWLHEHSDEFHADTGRIFFGGSSAGAHLACMSACIAANDRLRANMGIRFPVRASQVSGVVLIYGGYNLRTIINSGFPMIRTMVRAYTGNIGPHDNIWSEVSPVDHINADFPPVFIAAGRRDHLFGQSLELAGLLGEKGIEYDSLFFDENINDAAHGFLHFHKRECTQQTYRGIIGFMNSKAGAR